MVGLNVQGRPHIFAVGNFLHHGCSELLVIVAAYCSGRQHQVLVAEGGDDGLEDTDADAAALWIEAVEDVDGLEARVLVDCQTVVFQEGLEQLGVGQRGICHVDGARDVVDDFVYLVSLDAVVLLQTFVDVVNRLLQHHLLGGYGYQCEDVKEQEYE